MAYKALTVKKKAAKKKGEPRGPYKKKEVPTPNMPTLTSLPEEERVPRLYAILKRMYAEELDILKRYSSMSGGEKKMALTRLTNLIEEIGLMKTILQAMDPLQKRGWKKAKKAKKG